ncbi:MAG: ABC transporter permease [Xenophilus sp.]
MHALANPAVPGRRAALDAEARERRWMLANTPPAAALVTALLVLPVLWLLALSFSDAAGHFTLRNYVRIFDDAGYARAAGLTLWMAALTTAVCLAAGYTLAYALTLLPAWAAALAMAVIALPFWTSVLVRTYAWLVLLQHRGIVNSLLVRSGLLDAPLPLMHNAAGALIGMIHIMLPFMVFPLYAALRKVDADHLRAAAGMGASPTQAFWRVLFPQTLPGIVAGCVLVFVLGLGFYVTPALLGGGRTVVMSILIERDISNSMDWGTASAAAMLFVAMVLGLFAAAGRYVPIDRMFQR